MMPEYGGAVEYLAVTPLCVYLACSYCKLDFAVYAISITPTREFPNSKAELPNDKTEIPKDAIKVSNPRDTQVDGKRFVGG